MTDHLSDDPRLAEEPTRDRIRDHVAAHPGVHFNALLRRLDIASGQAQYHLRRLTAADDVHAESRYGRTHYFTGEFDPWERHAVAVLRRETARDIVAAVIAEDPVTPVAVADDLGIARSTLEYHLDHLVDADLVRKRHDDASRVTLTASTPADTLRLLDLVTPSLPDRLVDRFERLVDTI